MKSLTRNRLIAATALLALSGSALAQSADDNESGWLIGGALGRFDVSLDELDDVDDAIEDLDADDTAWKLFTGYRFNKNITVEVAYVNFGEPGDDFESGGTSGDYNVEISGFAPSVVFSMPVGPVELFARLGYYFYDVDVNVDLDDLGSDVFQTSDSGEDMMWGVGVGMTFMERLNARIEYEKIDVEATDDAKALWLSASWRF
jgi:hypothetical protein